MKRGTETETERKRQTETEKQRDTKREMKRGVGMRGKTPQHLSGTNVLSHWYDFARARIEPRCATREADAFTTRPGRKIP